MNFDWLLYLQVADKLMGLSDAALLEAYWRSATSRSYYAVFGEIRYRLEREGHVFGRSKVHSQVIRTLRSSRTRIRRRVGINLDRLRKERNRADYDRDIKFARRRAQRSYQFAKEIEKALPELL